MSTIKSPSLPFNESLIAAAPHTTGVYALWHEACAGAATIRTALAEHLKGEIWGAERATRCSWEIAEDAERRFEELLQAFQVTHGAAPRWNDPQRLLT
jgi:hypothetical protein